MTFIFIVFAIFVSIITRFSVLAGKTHSLSVDLQNRVERMMVEAGRPACLEQMDVKSLKDRLAHSYFGTSPVAKRLVFVDGPICE